MWKTSNVRVPFGPLRSASVRVGEEVFISGGWVQNETDPSKSRPSTILVKWSVDAPSWTFLANMSHMEANHNCMVSDGVDRIWVIGPISEVLQEYTISKNEWSTISTKPNDVNLNYYLCVYWDGHIIIRSQEAEVIFHIFDVTAQLWKMSKVPETKSYIYPMIAIIPWK